MTDKPTSNPSVFQTTPKFPDPTAAAEQLMKLAANADAAVRTAAQRAVSVEPLPYDPFAVAKAFGAFSMGLWSDPTRLVEAQARGWRDWAALWGAMAARASGDTVSPVIEPARGDRRFSSPAWSDEPVFDYIKQAYLLASQQLQDLVAETNLDEKTRAQVDFFSRQVLNALSPSNYAHTNPDVVRKTLETGGLNLMTGFSNLLEDLAEGQGLVKRRAPADFELGRNIAATPGAVVFENDLMQLIQYAPSTGEVYRRPLLFVPPLVNKYYLFDLTPKASYLKWLVDQGHTVFVISWVNPTEQHAAKDLSDYVKDGVLASLDAIELATGERSVDLVSYCLGGTLSAITMALLAARGEGERIASATLIAALVDFKNIGEWSVFLGEGDLDAFERYLDGKGYVEAQTFWRNFFDGITALRDARGMTVIMIAHSQVQRVEDPTLPAYDRHGLKLHKRASALAEEFADVVLYAAMQTNTITEDSGFNNKRTRATTTGERVMHTVGQPAFLAKSRYSLSSPLPLTWEAFALAMQPDAPVLKAA